MPFCWHRAGRPTALDWDRGQRRRGAEWRATTAGGARIGDEGATRPTRRGERINVGGLRAGSRRQRAADPRRRGGATEPWRPVHLVVVCPFPLAPTTSVCTPSPINRFHFYVWVIPTHFHRHRGTLVVLRTCTCTCFLSLGTSLTRESFSRLLHLRLSHPDRLSPSPWQTCCTRYLYLYLFLLLEYLVQV